MDKEGRFIGKGYHGVISGLVAQPGRPDPAPPPRYTPPTHIDRRGRALHHDVRTIGDLARREVRRTLETIEGVNTIGARVRGRFAG